MASTSSAAPAFGVLVDTEDTRRIQRLTKQGRHLEEEEYAQSVELREQFRLQVQRNPRMLHIYRHAFGCLEAGDMETKLLDTENREWREDVKAKRDAKDQRDRAMTAQDIKMRQDAKAEMLRKKAAEKAKYARTAVVPGIAPVCPPTHSHRGEKRAASAAAARPPSGSKRPKHSHVPAVGDWTCAKCGWSNARILIKCQKHLFGGGRCGVRKNDPAFTHEEQEEGPGIKFFQSSAKYIGDWRCSVCRWWHGTNVKNCRKCEKPVDECKDAEDWSNTLDPPNPHYMDSSRDFWNGNDREDAASLPHFQDAKYLGVAGKFKEKKNPYHLR
ncbi:hypothetical protein HBI81_115540 [Parastagonospora nodorum]|nr:hypothetical protein HBH47_128320 [Parastagonospora nodorum]KAH4157740.1 hypothetical protein HBH43_196560 [Parastagonospora nodorum]KAH4193418.1 hypothetical protein HBH42_100380 [Parastagonospora nodorum]KAH4259942.1 hypothetical protein HBI03_130710 [Parastagonospora nodorum]KAH4264094.1 hypothetical protein HBI04_191510 [Parastagonospora nodorum]